MRSTDQCSRRIRLRKQAAELGINLHPFLKRLDGCVHQQSRRSKRCYKKLNSAVADSENNLGGSSETMYFIGLDVHKKRISYCVKDAAGCVQQEGKVGSTRRELDVWVKTLPQPRTIAMEVTIFVGWIYDHRIPFIPSGW